MFEGRKRKLLEEMNQYATAIQFATCERMLSSIRGEVPEQEARTLTAASVNRLFGKVPSLSHADLTTSIIDNNAVRFLKNESDANLLKAIVMSLRTFIVIAAESHDDEAVDRIMRTIQWIGSIISLPDDASNPVELKQFAMEMCEKYYPK